VLGGIANAAAKDILGSLQFSAKTPYRNYNQHEEYRTGKNHQEARTALAQGSSKNQITDGIQ
jgi:hypothetical protein